MTQPMLAISATAPEAPVRAAGPRGVAAWIWNGRRPRLVLVGIAAVLYAPSLLQSFAVDDYRFLRLLDAYWRGERSTPGLYEFLRGSENAAMRREGVLPWWVSDDFRFAYFRPFTEAFIAAEYRAFGPHALGFRITGLMLYVLGLFLALALYREWAGDGPLARWAAVLFALAHFNVIPAVFVAAQCDLLALVCCVGVVLCASRFARRGAAAWLMGALVLFALGLLSKEVSVAAAVLPIGGMIAARRASDAGVRGAIIRRSLLATVLMVCMSLALIAYHGTHGYGSNAAMLLDPIGAPLDYLRRMPVRALLLLACWIAPINPQWFDLYDWMRPFEIAYLVVGLAAVVAGIRLFYRRFRHDPAVRAFAFWPLPFLPLLACTNPDNRVMMLPAVGLSFLGAAWLTGRTSKTQESATEFGAVLAADGAAAGVKLARIPLVIFILMPFAFCSATVGSMGEFERRAAYHIKAGMESFDRATSADDFVFMLNSYWQFDVLWSMDRTNFLFGADSPRVSYLAHVSDVRPEVVGPRTLRLRAATGSFFSDAFFSTFTGRLAMTRTQPVPPLGTRYDAGEFVAVISEVQNDRVTAVDFEFRQPLDSPHYRFLRLDRLGPPTRWTPSAE